MPNECVAKILILDPEDNVLVLRIGDYKEKPHRSHTPDFPGGLVDPGEGERDAVVREVKEEAGIILDEVYVRLVYAQTELFLEESKSVTKMLYMVRVAKRPEITISWEHEAFEWSDFNSVLKTHKFRPFYDTAIRYILDNNLIKEF